MGPGSIIAARLPQKHDGSLHARRPHATIESMRFAYWFPCAVAALLIGSFAYGETLSAHPLPVPALYVTKNYGLMVRVPPRRTYCPLPADWVGSDHGTTVFLVPPADCAATAGYPSTARSWSGGCR
jgi:hypothetical protein